MMPQIATRAQGKKFCGVGRERKADRNRGQQGNDTAMITSFGGKSNFFPHRMLSCCSVQQCGRSSHSRPIAMLQRKQSLFLLLAAVSGALTFFFPVDSFVRGDQSFIFRTTGLFMGDGTAVVDATAKIPFGVLLGFLSVMLFAVIFLYKSRTRQLRLTRIVNLLTVAVVVFLFITDNSIRAYLEQGGHVQNTFGISAGLPLLMVVFTLLAYRWILKDDALVRSMDRLR